MEHEPEIVEVRSNQKALLQHAMPMLTKYLERRGIE